MAILPINPGEILNGSVIDNALLNKIKHNFDAISANPVVVSSDVIDWTTGNVFNKELTESQTFHFANEIEGKVITVIVRNNAVATIQLTFSGNIFKSEATDLDVEPGKENIYTFIRSNGKTYLSYLTRLSNA